MHTVQNRLSTAVKILRMLKLSFKNNNQANLPEISTCRIQNEAMLTLKIIIFFAHAVTTRSYCGNML